GRDRDRVSPRMSAGDLEVRERVAVKALPQGIGQVLDGRAHPRRQAVHDRLVRLVQRIDAEVEALALELEHLVEHEGLREPREDLQEVAETAAGTRAGRWILLAQVRPTRVGRGRCDQGCAPSTYSSGRESSAASCPLVSGEPTSCSDASVSAAVSGSGSGSVIQRSNRRCASESVSWTGGCFIATAEGTTSGPPSPRSMPSLAQRTASMTIPP